MDESLKKKITEAGIDFEDGLNRFIGNDGLYTRFLKKFYEDETMKQLRKALEEDQTDEAFRSAHTLKGVSGNLSLKELYSQISKITNFLRDGNLAEAKKHMPWVEAAYDKVIHVIKEI